MFSDAFLFRHNEYLITAIVLVAILAATEAGFRVGRGSLYQDGTAKSQHTILQSAIMGLLALLLAFTFNMSASRFELRKQLVTDEANAIGTACLRARLLPEAMQNDTLKLLRSYIDARLACYRGALDAQSMAAAAHHADDLQARLWSQAVTAARDAHSIPAGLFARALNHSFDVASRRDAAHDNHVPDTVMFLLFLMAALSMCLLGFGCGLGNCRHLLTTTAIGLLVSLVILIIFDLDRPRRGLITISQDRLIELRDSIR